MIHPGSIVVIDFGGQYAHLIANRVRRLGAYSEICPAETPAAELKGAAGIILSGGPQSVYEKGSPQADPKIFDLKIPILGLCYGHQWIAHALKGKVTPGKVREYGEAEIEVTDTACALFKDVPLLSRVWMSHGDEVGTMPQGFRTVARSPSCALAAMADDVRKIYGLQFHVEVTHSTHGLTMLKNFLAMCDAAPWSVGNFRESIADEIRKQVGKRNVFMFVSGGVDSAVAFTLLNEVLGPERVQGLLVDTGFMRKGEVEQIQKAFKKLKIKNLHIEDASDEFFSALEGIVDPEEKRNIIGEKFLEVQRRVSAKMGLEKPATRNPQPATEWLLGQGTIYPDTIETKGTKHADRIKTHHNRVDAIQQMAQKGLVVEPLKELYKDEVRELGEELGLPHDLVWRHPFPGPGLAVRILCAVSPSHPTIDADTKSQRDRHLSDVRYRELPIRSVGVQGDGRTYRHPIALFSRHPWHVTPDERRLATLIPNAVRAYNRVVLCTSHAEPPEIVFSPGSASRDRADLLRQADGIVQDAVRKAGLYEEIWQFPVVLLPFGTMHGGQAIVMRPVRSVDAMTADAYIPSEKFLQTITEKLMALPGIEMVFLDLTSKPPGTIEWE